MGAKKKEIRQRDVLELLRSGITQVNACKTTGTSESTWYNWKKDPDFCAVVENALAEGKALRDSLGAKPEFSAGDTALDLFLNLYTETGLFEDSCKAAKLEIQSVLQWVNPLSAAYKPTFHSLYEDARKLLEIRAEDAIASNIQRKGQGSTADAKWLLERRQPEIYGTKKSADEEPKKASISPEQALEVLKNLLGTNASAPEQVN